MEKFYVRKRILANGVEWDRILKNGCVKGSDTMDTNYFDSEPLRDAWKEMETHFCAETVMSFINEIDRIYGDEFVPEVILEEINRVVVRFSVKGCSLYEESVEYVFCGDNLNPVTIEYGK